MYYNPQVTVLHYKRQSSVQNQERARYEFHRAMYLFYRKHYAQDTPLWLHWLVIAGILLQGGMAMLPVIRFPDGKELLEEVGQ